LSSILNIPATPQSGYLSKYTGGTWSSIVNATTADQTYQWGTNAYVSTDNISGLHLNRTLLVFNTSVLPWNAKIERIFLVFYTNSFTGTIYTKNWKVYKASSPTLSSGLSLSDYNLTNYTTDYLGPGSSYSTESSGWEYYNISDYSPFIFTDIKSPQLTLVLRESGDYSDIERPIDTSAGIEIGMSVNTPYLQVSYTLPSYIKKVNGLDLDSVSSFNKTIVAQDDFKANDIELVSGWNTFIGGIQINPDPLATGATGGTNTAAKLAYKLGIPVKRIRNFVLDGNNIKCFIVGHYNIGGFAGDGFNQYKNLTSYRDYGTGLHGATGIAYQAFYNSSIIDGYFPGVTGIGDAAFDQNFAWAPKTALKSLYIPNVIKVGPNNSNDQLFRGGNNSASLRVYANPVLQTSNLSNTFNTAGILSAGTGTLTFNQGSGMIGNAAYQNFAVGQSVSGSIITPGTTVTSASVSYTTTIGLSSPTTNIAPVAAGLPLIFTWPAAKQDGDLLYLTTVTGAPIRYVTDTSIPNAVTNLSVSGITTTTVVLNFTSPAVNVNPISFYDVYLNDFCLYSNRITAPGQTITGLTSGTNYALSIRTADTFYNSSVSSNVVYFTTL
jgi:hypothetical protein